MEAELVKIQEINIGWEMRFEVKFSNDETAKCNSNSLEYVGDYEIEFKNSIMSFNCVFDRGELRENETIDERIDLIKKDVQNIAKSCVE